MVRTCPLSAVWLVLYRTGISACLVHASLLLVEVGLQDLRRSSTEHEKIVLLSDKYKCSPHRDMCGCPNASGELLAYDHWRVLVSSISTVDTAMLYPAPPPATIRWVGVVTVAGWPDSGCCHWRKRLSPFCSMLL